MFLSWEAHLWLTHSSFIIIWVRRGSLELHPESVCVCVCAHVLSECLPSCIWCLITQKERQKNPPHMRAYLYFTAFLEIVSGVKIMLCLEMENRESREKWERVQNRCVSVALLISLPLISTVFLFIPFCVRLFSLCFFGNVYVTVFRIQSSATSYCTSFVTYEWTIRSKNSIHLEALCILMVYCQTLVTCMRTWKFVFAAASLDVKWDSFPTSSSTLTKT